MRDDDQTWLLSFYRTSEISGSLFFGRLARSMKPGALQHDMSKHFADEAQHAWYWTDCIHRLGREPLRLGTAYQDQYLAATGLPANLMEVLAITQIFERRVINQYANHSRIPGLDPVVRETLRRIMADEAWHIRWVKEALKRMEPEFGEDVIAATVRRFTDADREVYRKTVEEHGQRVESLMQRSRSWASENRSNSRLRSSSE